MDLKEVKSMLAERVMEWTRQWEQEGFQKGHERGLEEGRQEERQKDLAEARSALVEAIEQRFGPVPEIIRQRIAAMGSVREIVLATARAATAPSLDALEIP
jgi:flagellar biosynthesis/type III secretory pathway protein FliH